MKHFFAFCRRNRLFAALLAAELAVVCAPNSPATLQTPCPTLPPRTTTA